MSDAISAYPDDLEEMIRVGLEDSSLTPDEQFRFHLSLAVSAFTLAERSDINRLFSETELLYPFLLFSHGLQLRKPVTTHLLAMAIEGIMDGGWLRRIYGLEDVNPTAQFRAKPSSDLKEWSIDAIAVWAIVQTLTESISQPRPSGVAAR